MANEAKKKQEALLLASVLYRYLIHAGSGDVKPLIQIQPSERMSALYITKLGFYFACGASLFIALNLFVYRVLDYIVSLFK